MSCFQSLYYTDCRPGQGLRGGAGFQFQAVSAGTGADVLAAVERSALYEAPVAWMRDRRPVSEYPPSLVHVHDGTYLTARGIYLGAEAGGVREGNQFTHALSTSDGSAYGPTRPAQLWGSPCWAERPATGTECAPVAADPEPGPLGVHAVRDHVRNRPGGQEWLLAVTSAFERVHEPGAPRIVFVAADPVEVLHWIAAGTLLLPQTAALRIGFRVFAANPQYCGHEVLAVHPDWAGRWSEVRRDDGFAVFDLENGRHSPVEPTPAAQHWVPRFLGADPFDVVDAVELAHRFARGADRERATAAERAAAGVLVLDDQVQRGEMAWDLAGWVAAEAADDEARSAVLDAILAARPDVPVLRRLAPAVSGAAAGEVRLALLRAELDDLARGASSGAPVPLPAAPWTPDDHRQAAELLAAAARRVPPERVDRLLRLVTSAGVTPDSGALDEAVARFVRWWAATPGAPVDPDGWPDEVRVVESLREELAFRLRGPHAGSTESAVRDRWWPLLLPAVRTPDHPLDALVVGAAFAAGGRGRRDALAAVRGALEEAGPAGWDALFRQSVPAVADVAELVADEDVPDSLVQRIADLLVESEVDERGLGLLRLLGGRTPAGALTDLRAADDALRDWLHALPDGDAAQPDVPEAVLAARAPAVAAVLLRLDLSAAEHAASAGTVALQRVLAEALPAVWNARAAHDRADKAVALAYLVRSSDRSAEEVRADWDTALTKWIASRETADHARITRLLRHDPEAAAGWQDQVQRLTRVRRQPARGVFRRKKG